MTPEQRVIQAARSHVKLDNPDTYARLVRALEILDGKEVDPEPPVWVPATWGDVQKGDRVRYQSHETVVPQVKHDYEHISMAAKIRGRWFWYDPAEPVEIQMDSKRRNQGGIPF